MGDPASTTRQATWTWWVVFLGPASVALAVGIAGVVGHGEAAIWTFTVGVWALTLTISVAAMPRGDDGLFWLRPFLASVIAAATGTALLFGVSTVGVAVRENMATTTTTTPPSLSTSTTTMAPPASPATTAGP